MSLIAAAVRLAATRRSTLSTEDFALLVNLMSDDTTDIWLFRALQGLPPTR